MDFGAPAGNSAELGPESLLPCVPQRKSTTRLGREQPPLRARRRIDRRRKGELVGEPLLRRGLLDLPRRPGWQQGRLVLNRHCLAGLFCWPWLFLLRLPFHFLTSQRGSSPATTRCPEPRRTGPRTAGHQQASRRVTSRQVHFIEFHEVVETSSGSIREPGGLQLEPFAREKERAAGAETRGLPGPALLADELGPAFLNRVARPSVPRHDPFAAVGSNWQRTTGRRARPHPRFKLLPSFADPLHDVREGLVTAGVLGPIGPAEQSAWQESPWPAALGWNPWLLTTLVRIASLLHLVDLLRCRPGHAG